MATAPRDDKPDGAAAATAPEPEPTADPEVESTAIPPRPPRVREPEVFDSEPTEMHPGPAPARR